MNKALHLRDVTDNVSKKKKKVERGLDSIEGCVDASIERLEEYVKKLRKTN